MKRCLAVLAAVAAAGANPARPEPPPDSHYVTVNEHGHLAVNGQRQRFWAAIGKVLVHSGIEVGDDAATRARKIERSRRGTLAILDRLDFLGFNAVRFWNALGGRGDYSPGDGSPQDCVDFFVAEAGRRGFRLWTAGAGNALGVVEPEDANILADPATEAAWKAAIIHMTPPGEKGPALRGHLAVVWDPRLEALAASRMARNALHFNRHTGLRWADDPTFAIWELSNEEWWFSKMAGGRWRSLPPFFQNSLLARWQDFLRRKYGRTPALSAAWGRLGDGESLEEGTVRLEPLARHSRAIAHINDGGASARAALAPGEDRDGNPAETFSRARAGDVIAFLLDLQLGHKKRLAAALRSTGKSPRLGVVLFDTGIGYEIQSQFLHQSAGAAAHDAYVNGWGLLPGELEESEAPPFAHGPMVRELERERLTANSGRWINWLLKPPGICQGVPWLEHNRIEGMPFLVYETQIQQPAKYRADFPLRLLALAAIQDWDWVSWHYFEPHDDVGVAPNPWDRAMDITTGEHPQGYHYTYDEVQSAMMRAAGYAFRNGALEPAPHPVHFVFGHSSLHDPASMLYAGSYGIPGMNMLPTVYSSGARIRIAPERREDEVKGEPADFSSRSRQTRLDPTRQITFDWEKGFLSMDARSFKAFAGLAARAGNRWEFEGGWVFDQLEVHNDKGIFDPVDSSENYLALAIYSENGEPLETSDEWVVSAVSTSFNSGFALGTRVSSPWRPPEGTVAGRLPVLFARVSGRLRSPRLDGCRFSVWDWNGRLVREGVVRGDSWDIQPREPAFFVRFVRQEGPSPQAR